MPIRPLDMQVMVPRMENVARMRHAENQKAGIDQNNISATNQKQVATSQQTVVSSHKNQEMDQHQDAKEEGKNKYAYKKPDGKQHKDEEPEVPKSYHKIDIKI